MRSFRSLVFLSAILIVGSIGWAQAQTTDETPPFPGDVSPNGLAALAVADVDSTDTTGVRSVLPEAMATAVRDWLNQTYEVRAGHVRNGLLSVPIPGPGNVRVNNPAGDAIGETQAEVAVAAFGDTVVVGFNDSKGFTAGFTISSFGYSTDGGATFTDGGNVPLALPTDQAFGDPGIDTDEQGNWYYNQIYTRTGPPAQQNIGVHHGRFNGAGQLVWDSPTQASIGTSATGALDKCLLACDRVTGNVYVSYTRFTAIPRIEIARSTNHGTTWDPAVLLDNGTTPTSSKQAARPFCGPNGEVYVVWEKGANTINCPDGSGNVSNTTGNIAFTRSLDFGVTYAPLKTIGTVEHSWTWSGPGDLRERANEFPDIAVDRSGGPMNGNIYVVWHESAPWTSNLAAGPVNAEVNNAANNNPGGAQVFSVGQDVTGSISAAADLDYWQFSAVQGQSYLLNLDPQGFVCGVSGTSRGMRMRLFATQTPYPVANAFPDTILAASALGAFAQRIVWTAPKTGDFLIRLQASSGTVPFTYTLRVRSLTFGVPSPARDARDVVFVRSTDGGANWSAEQLLNDDPAGLENRRPFICVDALGHVHAFWHDSRTPGFGSNAALTSVFGTTSRDGGLTWTPNYCVTDQLSFFSFNTIAVPNLGDYNQAAASGALIHPAWSDQRLSTGDVRNPVPPPTFTAGTGPETFTTGLLFDFSVTCPADLEVCTFGGSFQRTFTITNTGNVPDNYAWECTQSGTMTIAPASGTTGLVAPGASANVTVTVTVPADCSYPSSNTLTFTATPVGDTNGAKSCTSAISCPVFMTLDLDPNTFNLRSMGNWVTGYLEPPAPFTAEQIDVSTIRLEGSVAVDPDGPTAIGDQNGNGIPDLMVKFSRSALELLLAPGASVPVTVTGTIDGHCFIGQDMIRIINAPVTHPAEGSSVAMGRTTTIEWQTPNGVNPKSVAILWSYDKGAHWSLVDQDLPNSGTYTWSVPQTPTQEAKVAVVLVESSDGGYIVDGVLGTSGIFTLGAVTGVGDNSRATLGLHIVSPTASARGLEVAFSLPDGQPATLAVYDVVGRKVASREVGDLGVGEHTTRFGERASLPAGIYVVQLIQGGHRVTARAALIH
jgi:hypothetical protein